MQGPAAVPVSTSSPVRSEVIEAEPNQVVCAAAVVDNPGRRAYTTVSHTLPKIDGFADQLQRCGRARSYRPFAFNAEIRARSLDALQRGINPLLLIGQTTPRIVYRSINAGVGTVDKARRSGGRSQNGAA